MPTNPYAAPDITRTSEPPQAWRLEYTMGWQEYAQIAPALHQHLKRKWWVRLCIFTAWVVLAALLALAYTHIGLWALCALVPLAIILFENLLVLKTYWCGIVFCKCAAPTALPPHPWY